MKTKTLLLLLTFFALTVSLVRGSEPVNEPAKPAPEAPAEPPAATLTGWLELKNTTYDQRELFLAGLKGLEARVDEQIDELVAQRAAMAKANVSTDAWDMLMQEVTTARTNLKSNSDDMRRASRENWDQMKDQVGLAWERTQDAYTRVKASTTSSS